MSFEQKDLLKFALDLFQKTKETGSNNYWSKDGLEAILEAIKKIYPGELSPSSLTGRDKKSQQEHLHKDPMEDENQTFWKQNYSSSQNGALGHGQTMGDVSPVSIYETSRDVNIQAILPGIVSPEDLHLLISQEVIELYGIRVPPGGSKPVDNFHKTIRLHATVEPARATAAYRKGLLSLSVPKKKPDPPAQISVKFD